MSWDKYGILKFPVICFTSPARSPFPIYTEDAMKRLALGLLVLATFATIASGAVINVPADYTEIQDAIQPPARRRRAGRRWHL